MQEQMIHKMDPRQKYRHKFHSPVVRKAAFRLHRLPHNSNNMKWSNTKFKSIRSLTKKHKTSPTQKQQRPLTFPAVFVLHFGLRPPRHGGSAWGRCDAVHPTPCPPTRRENMGQMKNVHNIRVSSAFNFSLSRIDNDPKVFNHVSSRYQQWVTCWTWW